MASTTNYSWSTPDNSGLVKNGAQDIRTLGSAIDTSVWNVGFGQAGKNKIINGNFGIWQRGTSIALGGSNTYTADRWGGLTPFGDSVTASQQSFTVGAAPVSGYESQYFLRLTRASGTGGYFFSQRIEDVRTFAGQTVTLSFWAKASVGFTPSNIYGQQNFGTGGSTAVGINPSPATMTAITTSWVRYTYTYNIPSISGKTIGTGSSLEFIFNVNPGTASSTVDIWGVQVEAGSIATPFQLAGGGDPQSELALCQRYYQRHSSATANTDLTGMGVTLSSADGYVPFTLFVPFRAAPSTVDYSQIRLTDVTTLSVDDCVVTIASSNADFVTLYVTKTAAGFLLNRPCFVRVDASGNGYVGLSAEL